MNSYLLLLDFTSFVVPHSTQNFSLPQTADLSELTVGPAAAVRLLPHPYHPPSSARYILPVFTGRVDGPCLRVVWTGAREHGP